MNTTNKKPRTKVVASFDLGGSHSKLIVQVYPLGVPIVIAMEPFVADVGKNSIMRLSTKQLPQNSAWVGIGEQYYVLGALAKDAFAGTAALRDLKSQYGLPKLAGLLWLACSRLGLKGAVDAYLQLLLPPGEVSDGSTVETLLSSALTEGIITPTGKLKAKLRNFYVAPEGGGIMTYRSRTLGKEYSQKNIGLLMLGYRNASFTLAAKSSRAKSVTRDLGMNWLVQKFVEDTAVGLSADDLRLAQALVQANHGDFDALGCLSRKTTPQGIQSDLNKFKSVLVDVRDEYCRALIHWIRNITTLDLDEMLICGGTAEFVCTELTEYFQKQGTPIVWNGGVQIPSSLDTHGLGDRIADVWTSHITYIKILDHNFAFERNQPLVVHQPKIAV